MSQNFWVLIDFNKYHALQGILNDIWTWTLQNKQRREASGSRHASTLAIRNGILWAYPTKRVANLALCRLWHDRFGQINEIGVLNIAQNRIARDLPHLSFNNASICHFCAACRAHRTTSPKFCRAERTYVFLDFGHTDVYGPIERPSGGGAGYFVTFIDDQCRWVVVYPNQSKA